MGTGIGPTEEIGTAFVGAAFLGTETTSVHTDVEEIGTAFVGAAFLGTETTFVRTDVAACTMKWLA